MFFDGFPDLARVAIISVLAYAGLVSALRLAGKRSLAKMNAFDLVVTVAFGSVLATVLLSKSVALLEGLLAFAMLALLQWLVSRGSLASPLFRKLVRSRPRLLLEQGRFREQAMKEERVVRSEIEASVRSAGIGRIEDVAAVVLETDGSLSVIRQEDKEPTLLRDVAR